MEIIFKIVSLFSHLAFIAMVNQLLRQLFDWSKWLKQSPENIQKLSVFLLLLSIAIGYLVSRFVLEVLDLSQSIFFVFQ